MKVLFLFLVTFAANLSYADSFSWEVSGDTVSIYAQNFKIDKYQVSINCQLGDADSIEGATYISTPVTSTIQEGMFAGSGTMYLLKTSDSDISGGRAFKAFQNCVYALDIQTNKERNSLNSLQIKEIRENGEPDDLMLSAEVPLILVKDKSKLSTAKLPTNKVFSLVYIEESDRIYYENNED